MTTGVYLLHFDKPLCHASHYVGWSSNIEKRVAAHNAGTSQAHITRAAARKGIKMILVRVWIDTDRGFERRLKNWHNHKLLCPICKQNGG